MKLGISLNLEFAYLIVKFLPFPNGSLYPLVHLSLKSRMFDIHGKSRNVLLGNLTPSTGHGGSREIN